MANSNKNLVITPNIGSANDPNIVFSGADASTAAQNITLTAYPTNGGTLSFDGSAGQLFSVTNSMSGTIFSANDVSGIPSLEILDTGLVKIAQYSGNVLLGTSTDTGLAKLQITGSVSLTGNILHSPTGRSIYGPNPTWSSYLYVGGDGVNGITRTASIASIVTTNGNVHIDSGSDKSIYLNHYSGTGGIQFGNGATGVTATLSAAGVFTTTGDVRAPIYYDSNNTAYYLDPTSSTALRTVGSWRADSSGWDGEFSGKIQYHANHWYLQGADLLIFRNSGGSNVFTVNQSGAVSVSSDVRSPIYYDSNDTAYYVDPASTSRVNTLNVVGTVSGARGVFSDSSGSGAAIIGAYSTVATNGTTAIIRQTTGGGNGNQDIGLLVDIQGATDTDRIANFRYYDGSTYTSRMAIMRGGNVGIGTTSPSQKLDVIGSIYSTTQINTNTYFQSRAVGVNPAILLVPGSGSGTTWGIRNNVGLFELVDWSSTLTRLAVLEGGNVGIGTTSPSQKLDVQGTAYASSDFRAPIFYDSANTAYYVDPASTSNLNILNIGDGNLELYKSVSVDMSNVAIYSVSNYYPVTINIGTEGCIIQIQNNLSTNVPSWSTHGAGFTLNLRWRTNGSGWGTTEVRRYIEQYHERFANQTICGGITQMTNNSTEVVWLRGGGFYSFKLSRDLSPTPRSTAYTVSGQTVTPTSAAQNTIWNSATGTSFLYTEILYDHNNSAYYCDPASTSNLNAATFAGAVTAAGSLSTGNVLTLVSTPSPSTAAGTIYNNNGTITFRSAGAGGFNWNNAANSANAMILTDAGAATFAGAVTSSGKITGQLLGISGGGSNIAGTIYSDANWGMIFTALQASPNNADFLFLNSAGVERARITSTTATFAGAVSIAGDLTVGNGTSSNIYMSDTDEGTRRIHCNSNRIGFLDQNANWGAYCDDSGNWFATNLSGTNTGDQTVGNGALTLGVSGTGLSGTASFSANQSGATTFTVTSNATSANTASAIVARDASGNFTAGTITAGSNAGISIGANQTSKGSLYQSSSGGTILKMAAGSVLGFIVEGTLGQTVFTQALGGTLSINPDGYTTTFGGPVNASISGSSTSCTGNAATATGQQSGAHFAINTGGTGYGLVGVYNPSAHQGLFAMGAAYTLGAAGTLANFYGVSWTYDNSGYALNTGYALEHCMAIANAGAVRTVIGVGIWTNGLIRANGAISSGSTITASAFSGPLTGNVTGNVTGTSTALVTGNNYQVNSFGVGTAASGTAGEIRATNNITAYYSDDRLKTKLGLISDPIEKVKSLSGFYFEANETAVALGYTKQREVGVSAQEVQAILPEIIAPAPIDPQYMTVRYEKLIPLLIEAIKAQQVQIEELKAQVTLIQQNLNNK